MVPPRSIPKLFSRLIKSGSPNKFYQIIHYPYCKYIKCTKDAFDIFTGSWEQDSVEHIEEFKLLLMNRSTACSLPVTRCIHNSIIQIWGNILWNLYDTRSARTFEPHQISGEVISIVTIFTIFWGRHWQIILS